MHVALQHLLENSTLHQSLLRTHIPAFLQRQRWYTSKDKKIQAIQLIGLPSEASNAGLWLAEITFAGEEKELRVLAVAEVERAFAPKDPGVICRTDKGVLIDALGEEGFRESMYALMVNEATIQAATGRLVGQIGSVCRNQPYGNDSHVPAQNSSNSVIVYPPNGFFKLFRKTEAGLHPDAELIAYLSESCGFTSVPAFGGAIRFEPATGGDPITLGLMLGKIDHQGEAWETFLHDIADYATRFKEEASLLEVDISGNLSKPLVPSQIPEVIRRVIGEETIARLMVLGKRTAEMHVHFAHAKAEGLKPEALLADDWAFAKTGLLDRIEKESTYAIADIAAAQRSIGDWVRSTTFPEVTQGKIRVHGDYHLGQVLITKNDVVIIDFEGEPLYTLAYRRQRHPAYKDVAGMVRSLHYAPYAYALQEVDGADWAKSAAKVWYRVASRLFLTSYHAEVGEASFLPANVEQRQKMLAFYLVDKAMYELAYERSSRPDWILIPQTGILGVAEMLSLEPKAR